MCGMGDRSFGCIIGSSALMAGQNAFCGIMKSAGTLGTGMSIVAALLSCSTMTMNTGVRTKRNFGRSLELSLSITDMFLSHGLWGIEKSTQRLPAHPNFFWRAMGKAGRTIFYCF